jgi:hypothetical protein
MVSSPNVAFIPWLKEPYEKPRWQQALEEMTLAPLSNKKLVRDLVTEIAPPAERFGDS